MIGAVIYGPGQLEVAEVSSPEIFSGEVLVEVWAAGSTIRRCC